MIMNNIPSRSLPLMAVLNRFETIPLEETLASAQMDRIDRKFLVHLSKMPEILTGLVSEYKIVEAAGSVVSPYVSLYFDTEDFEFYRKHHSGFLNHNKIRYRFYPNTNTTFLEVKRKGNNGRTYKSRILSNDLHIPIKQDGLQFLSEKLPELDLSTLRPAVNVKYYRVAFIAEHGKERFSLDININAELEGAKTDFGAVAILEVKQDHKHNTPVIERIREFHLREGSFSKYCITSSVLKPDLKSNLFKMDIKRIKKIMNEKNK